MRLAVVGSRDYPEPGLPVLAYIRALQEKLRPFGELSIVSGGARGVDHAAWEAANKLGLDIVELKPDWERFGRSAGFKRNEDIIRNADQVVAFWDGESRGTKHSIDLALKARIRTEVVFP